ncbi:MAG: DNA replication and repair protein RecF, partial [Bacteroidaceae bacterium]|nr:DNA replication and repair protein RecF [Bacteroidaceae bacterium]
MILKKLTLLNYRNIATAELAFSPKINCFVGHNGEGKTNVIDAIHFLSLTKSAVSPTDSMNVRHGEELMMVQGIYDLNGTEEEISIGVKLHQKKHVKRNKKEYKRIAEHIGLLPLIIASPNDATIINGGSDERRRLMDIVISQYDPEYLTALSTYNKALQQRNALLKAEEEPQPDILSLFEEMMAENGERIYQKRNAFIDEFIPVFQHFYRLISEDNETVAL